MEIIINTPVYVYEYIYLYIFFQNASAQAALQAASALSGQNETQGGPNTVLRVIVEHMVYPVTLEVLCQVSGNCQIGDYRNAPSTAFTSLSLLLAQRSLKFRLLLYYWKPHL
jgi:hypothetical protein